MIKAIEILVTALKQQRRLIKKRMYHKYNNRSKRFEFFILFVVLQFRAITNTI